MKTSPQGTEARNDPFLAILAKTGPNTGAIWPKVPKRGDLGPSSLTGRHFDHLSWE